MTKEKQVMEALWSFEELVEFTKIPKSTLKFYTQTEAIPSVKIGKHRRFIPEEIRKWLKSKAS